MLFKMGADFIPPLSFMSHKKRNKRFILLLITVLLFQLSYPTVHVYTAHLYENHIEEGHLEEAGLHSPIDDSNHTCDLCAKLLVKILFLWAIPLISFGLTAFYFLVLGRLHIHGSRSMHVLFLRGPPYHLG